MIKGFEEYTNELTDYERITILPVIIRGMITKVGPDNAITNEKAVKTLKGAGYKISGPRFRKVMHVIRVSGMIPGIVATSKGYYIATRDEDYENYIESLNDRLEHITALRDALLKQYSEYLNSK